MGARDARSGLSQRFRPHHHLFHRACECGFLARAQRRTDFPGAARREIAGHRAHENFRFAQCRQRARGLGPGRSRGLADAEHAAGAGILSRLVASLLVGGGCGRRALRRRLQGHQCRGHEGRGRRHGGPLGGDCGRRRQGPGLCAAGRGVSRQGARGGADRQGRAGHRGRAQGRLRYSPREFDGAGRGRGRARRPSRRHRAAVAGLREFRHVSRLRSSRRRVCRGGDEAERRDGCGTTAAGASPAGGAP